MAFVYLAAMSMGLLHNQNKPDLVEGISSNIINYEVLTAENEPEIKYASYNDYLHSNTNSTHQLTVFIELLTSQEQFTPFSPPLEEFLQQQYLLTSNLFNRPPPVTC